jgi:hypothetical protein
LDSLWLMLALLVPLLYLQRRLHFETQAFFLLLTRQPEIALALFSLLFLPGVLLHESSHYVMARLLGVRTGKFSLLPQPQESGRLRLGYVETASTDMVRDALIGLAPLLAGGVFVSYAGVVRLGFPELWPLSISDGPEGLLAAIGRLPERPDFWLWFYLTVAVSSTMFPSSTDRRAWLPLGLLAGTLLVAGLLVGAGPWMIANLAPAAREIGRSLTLVMSVTVAVQLIFLLPIWALRRILARLTGMEVR